MSRFLAKTSLLLACLSIIASGCGSPRLPRDESSVTAEVLERSGCDGAPLPADVVVSDGITEDEAVALALWNNAGFREALAELGFSCADLARANMLQNPSLSILFPFGVKQFEGALSLPLEAIWLRPKRLKVADTEARAVAERLVVTGLDLVRDVRTASADLALARARARLAEKSVELRREIAAVFAARVRSGAEPRSAELIARNAVVRAEDQVRQAQSEVRLAEHRLRGLTGLVFAKEAPEFLDPPAPGPVAGEVGALEAMALASRPDVRAAEIALEAAGARAGLAPAEAFQLSAILDSNGNGLEGFEGGPGVAVTLPIFNRNDGAAADARARIEKAGRHYVAVRESIALEVRTSFEKHAEARRAWESWKGPIMDAFSAAAKAATAELEHGEGARSLVLDAGIELHGASIRQAELEADVRRARAALERGVGRRLVARELPASLPATQEHP